MEVHMSNLPTAGNISDRTMINQLKPFMQQLGIGINAYDCEKPKKRPHCNVTFLREADGEKFLAKFGAVQRNGRKLARLNILGFNVRCEKSIRQPHEITLKGLVLRSERAAARAANEHEPIPAYTRPVLQVRSLEGGHYTYDKFQNNHLTFVSEFSVDESGTANFGKYNLIVKLGRCFVVRIRLTSIYEIVWNPKGSLTLTLTTVPLFFRNAESPQGLMKQVRLTSFGQGNAEKLGMCLVYHLNVLPYQMVQHINALKQTELFTVSLYEIHRAPANFTSGLALLKDTLSQATALQSLPFNMVFLLQALAYNAYLHPATVAALAQELIHLYPKRPVSLDAMKKLFQEIGWPSPNHPDPSHFEVKSLLDYLLEIENGIHRGNEVQGVPKNIGNKNLTQINRVVVTPTSISLHGPEFENKNRVLRKFPKHHDYFIRVQFCDESGQDMRFNYRIDFDHIYSRFKKIMTEGIQLGGRIYKFLGWSHSSLRAHSMWFVAPFFDEGMHFQTHFTIIESLGNFDHIFSPARCAARIGQAFSETPFAVPLAESGIAIHQVDDVTSADGSRMFSDGVGSMSSSAAEVVWNNIPHSKRFPTCLQIRFAGAKGMLSLDTRLSGHEIRIRPSMTKFESRERSNLEICDTASKPIPFYLNRQIIKILEDMGVARSWFIELQSNALQELRMITSTTYNMANFFKHQAIASSIKLHRLLRWSDSRHVEYRTEPFLRRTAEAVILRELRMLKHKARMMVPYGVSLFGVMDETGFLQEGQVYVTFNVHPRSASSRIKPPPAHKAHLLVTRSPALHPGDVQRAVQIVPPKGHALRNLSNCIVFSSHGERDLPSQLSGGDLDGDIFNIIWDRKVCRESKLQTFEPADYTRPPQVNIQRAVTPEDIAEFFIDFIKTDHLGAIATRHMILADQKEFGTRDQSCIAVAELHSTAVDFSKTGIPADLKKLPRANKYRPDFLSIGPQVYIHDRKDIEFDDSDVSDNDNESDDDAEGPTYKFYRSEKVLGELYRNVNEKKIWHDDIHTPVVSSGSDFEEAFLKWARDESRYLGCFKWEHRVDEAVRIRAAYEDSIRAAMNEYSEHPTLPITELEVFIGSIINKTGPQNPRQRDRSRKLRDEFERISTWITAQIRPKKRHRPEDGENGYDDSHDVYEYDNDDDDDDDDDNYQGFIPKAGRGGGGGAPLYDTRLRTLELCLACAHVHQKAARMADESSSYRGRGGNDELSSFFPLAASTLLREIDYVRKLPSLEPQPHGSLTGFEGNGLTVQMGLVELERNK